MRVQKRTLGFCVDKTTRWDQAAGSIGEHGVIDHLLVVSELFCRYSFSNDILAIAFAVTVRSISLLNSVIRRLSIRVTTLAMISRAQLAKLGLIMLKLGAFVL